MVTVRNAVVADAPRIARVQVRSWQVAYRGQIPQDYLDGLDVGERAEMWRGAAERADGAGRGVLVAEDDDRLLGFTSFSQTRDDDEDPERVGEIFAIYLDPDAWGTGCGRELMSAALERLTAAGFGEATLWVLDTNARARRFYAAAGFAADGAVKVDDRGQFELREVRYRRLLAG
jgi:RimJ/RimL family protein N-acetyltransferase